MFEFFWKTIKIVEKFLYFYKSNSKCIHLFMSIICYFRFLDSASLENLELTCKLFRQYIIQFSSWRRLTNNQFPKLYLNLNIIQFNTKTEEHIFYKKKHRMFWIVGHDCNENCYNCCNICLQYTDCFWMSFCCDHTWSDYLE